MEPRREPDRTTCRDDSQGVANPDRPDVVGDLLAVVVTGWMQALYQAMRERGESSIRPEIDPNEGDIPCPACGSEEVWRRHVLESAVGETFFWECQSCSHQWGHE